MTANTREHLLLYEPRAEGHHPSWLRMIAGDLLSANYRLSLALDLRPQSHMRMQAALGEVWNQVTVFPAHDSHGRRHADGKAESVAHCLRESGAERVFLCALDEIASDIWRRATFGRMPPESLRGRFGGLYHRSRFLSYPPWAFDRLLKHRGFDRLLTGGWLRQLVLLDEYQTRDCQAAWPNAPIFFLPNPCPARYEGDRLAARQQLGIAPDRQVFLFYGAGHRRKGLHLAVEALAALPTTEPAFLLCAGQLNPDPDTGRALEQLTKQGRALVLNRYVTSEEEQLCFVACDIVLLPYINHFGISAVLAQAVAANKPVIASHEQLLGRITEKYDLGLPFTSGNVADLAKNMREAMNLSAADRARFAAGAEKYAARYSRNAFRQALITAVGA